MSIKTIEGGMTVNNARFCVVVARWNNFVVDSLEGGAIDTLKRWAWVSVLALLATGSSMWFLFLGAGDPQHFIAGLLVVTVGAITLPQRVLVPNHDGAPVLSMIWPARPEFPTRLSFAVTANLAAAA